MKKLYYTNLSQTFIPIEIEFLNISDENFLDTYSDVLQKLIDDLIIIQYLNQQDYNPIQGILWDRYKISLKK